MIRSFRKGDEQALWEVFHSSIHTLAVDDYTREQRDAWAPHDRDAAREQRWVERMRAIDPIVFEHDGAPIAYADLQPNGFIDHFFVAGDRARGGIGTALMSHIVGEARRRGIDRLTSDVSLTAQPFYQRFGFVIVEQRMPVVRGVAMPNAAMRLALADG